MKDENFKHWSFQNSNGRYCWNLLAKSFWGWNLRTKNTTIWRIPYRWRRWSKGWSWGPKWTMLWVGWSLYGVEMCTRVEKGEEWDNLTTVPIQVSNWPKLHTVSDSIHSIKQAYFKIFIKIFSSKTTIDEEYFISYMSRKHKEPRTNLQHEWSDYWQPELNQTHFVNWSEGFVMNVFWQQ
jgi:hypothetical protein